MKKVNDYPEIKKELFRLQDMYGYAENVYKKGNPKFSTGTDVRLTVFAKCANVIASGHFGVHFIIENMKNEEWWKKTEPWARQIRMNHNYDWRHDLDEFDIFLRVGILTQHLRAIESSFRDYLRAGWPDASPENTGDFSRVYEFLLGELELDLQYKELLEIYNTVRNLIHNNGVYFPKYHSKKNPQKLKILTYRGTAYPFELKKIVEFTDWDFVQLLLRDCVDLLIVVVNHYKITRIPEIPDSFGKEL